MTPVTIQIRTKPAGGYTVELRVGSPAAPEDALAPAADLPADLSGGNAALDVKKIRADLLKSARVPAVDAVAKHLAGLLLPDPLRETWHALKAATLQAAQDWDQRSLKGEAKDPRPSLRTFLDLPPELDLVPFELARMRGSTLFLHGDLPVVRYRHYADGRKARPIGWQIRVLVVVAAEKPKEIEADTEVEHVRDALRTLDRVYDLDVLCPASRKALTASLWDFKPDILHIIGHGSEAHLHLFDGKVNQPWNAVAINTDFGQAKWTPQVVYLNACRSRGAAEDKVTIDDQARQWGIVETLLERGVLGVVAMQGDVRGTAAGICAAAFYRELVNGAAIDEALERGRAAIAQQFPGNEDAREPYLPVLQVTLDPTEILRHGARMHVPRSTVVDEALQSFVDRDHDRRKMVHALDEPKHAVLVHGIESIGKSSLLGWAMDLCQRRDFQVRYVALGACANWLEVLRAFRDGQTGKTYSGPVHEGFGILLEPTFNWRLNELANGRPDPPGAPVSNARDTAGDLNQIKASGLMPPDFEGHAMRLFDASLPKNGRTVVLVFDNVHAADQALSDADFKLLLENWIDPLIARGDGRVCALVAIRPEHRDKYGLGVLPPSWGEIPLDMFRAEQSKGLLVELFRLRIEDAVRNHKALKFPPDEMLAKLKEEVDRREESALTGAQLKRVLNLLWDVVTERKR